MASPVWTASFTVFRNRADLYRMVHAELVAELSEQRGVALMKRIIEKHGREAFLAVSPDQGRMYPTDV